MPSNGGIKIIHRQGEDGGGKNKNENKDETFIIQNHNRFFTACIFPKSRCEMADYHRKEKTRRDAPVGRRNCLFYPGLASLQTLVTGELILDFER